MRITGSQIIKNINLTSTQKVVRKIITVAPLGKQGFGVPSGGTAGQVLSKVNDVDYNTEWVDQTGGGGGIPDAPNNANAYVRSGLAWVIGYTKTAIDSLISNFQTASQVQTIADAKVSNEAYDEATWNGVTGVAPSKDAVRDKCLEIETSLNGINNNKADRPIVDYTQPTIALLAPSGEIYYAGTEFYPDTTELTHVKGVTSPIQEQIDFKQPLSNVLTNTTASFTTAQETKLAKYPSIATNGKFLQGNGDEYVEVDAPSGGVSEIGLYSFLANNTNIDAIPTEQVFKSVAEQAYTGAITWGTTAPTVILNNTYKFQIIGSSCEVRISLSYTNPATNSQVIIALPSDCPTPATITGFTSASEIIGFGSGMMFLDRATLPASAGRYCLLRRNSANTGYEIVVTHGTGISVRNVQLTIQYFI